ncbi:MAG: D-glycero-beta-D-manno-heptose 1,7-bisphosphate 7-phosphatase [Proteobacteria bacterium]|nr:D-glycero-beta-D-manno-heptose 1,7-bisphosphate 7-phosphatase [Pseudomonadota bacterium]
MMKKLIILDRDGVINYDSPAYIKSPDEFLPIPGSIEAIARLSQNGFLVAIATNQSGVSRGLYSEETLKAIHQKMQSLVSEAKGSITAIEYCLHMPDAGCSCRKPKPGMLENLAKKLGCSLKDSSFVGDRISDIEAAKAVEVKPIMILSPMTNQEGLKNHPEVPVFNSLADYVEHLVNA